MNQSRCRGGVLCSNSASSTTSSVTCDNISNFLILHSSWVVYNIDDRAEFCFPSLLSPNFKTISLERAFFKCKKGSIRNTFWPTPILLLSKTLSDLQQVGNQLLPVLAFFYFPENNLSQKLTTPNTKMRKDIEAGKKLEEEEFLQPELLASLDSTKIRSNWNKPLTVPYTVPDSRNQLLIDLTLSDYTGTPLTKEKQFNKTSGALFIFRVTY